MTIALSVDFPIVWVSTSALEALIELIRGNHALRLVVAAEPLKNVMKVNQ